ncbi:hypothetical protein ACMZ5A_29165 [Bacillus mobilis]|uniref:hypothetical protein n=1 Tax=Bacillus mobilis TaxID=2026190 RepID=UPI0039F09576
MTFGAHRAAFTVVAVVAVAGLLTAVALALINKPDGDNSAGLAADSRSATPARSMPPRTSKSASSPSAPAVATGAAQGTSAKVTAAKKPASPTVEFAETNTYCSGWRSTPEGSEVLKARGCVRVTGHPDGTTSMNNGRNVYSPTMSISSTGALTCRDMDDTWGTCAPFEYVSGS